MWAVSMLAAVVPGWLWMAALRPLTERRGWAVRLVELSLGAGFGAGIAAVVFFLSRVAGIASGWFAMGGELIVAAPAVWMLRRRSKIDGRPQAADRRFGWTWIPAAACGLSLAFFLASFGEFTHANPQGEWDAWNIWNLRAKYLAAGDQSWRNAVSPLLANHPDYPLLTSAFIAQSWALGGGTTEAVPVATALLFSLATVGLLIGIVSVRCGSALGWTAGAILVSAFHFHRWSASQYADVPLAFYFLAALSLTEAEERPASLALAGAFAAFGAWTKNEGIALLAIVAAARFAAGFRPGLRRLRWFVAGGAPAILLVAWFKLGLAPSAEPLFHQAPAQLVSRLSEGGRYGVVLGTLAREVVDMGSFPGHPLLALAALAFFLRLKSDWRRGANRALPLAVAGALACYLVVFLITPLDLAWQAQTALGRLLVQLWPAFVLAFFTALRSPEELNSPPAPAPA